MHFSLRGASQASYAPFVGPNSTTVTENDRTKALLKEMTSFIKKALDGAATLDETCAITKSILSHAKSMTQGNRYGTAFYTEAVNVGKVPLGAGTYSYPAPIPILRFCSIFQK